MNRRDDMEYVDVDDRIILKYVFSTLECGLDSYDSEQRPVAGSCEHGNRFKVFITGRECYSCWRKHEFLNANFVVRVIRTKYLKCTYDGDIA